MPNRANVDEPTWLMTGQLGRHAALIKAEHAVADKPECGGGNLTIDLKSRQEELAVSMKTLRGQSQESSERI